MIYFFKPLGITTCVSGAGWYSALLWFKWSYYCFNFISFCVNRRRLFLFVSGKVIRGHNYTRHLNNCKICAILCWFFWYNKLFSSWKAYKNAVAETVMIVIVTFPWRSMDSIAHKVVSLPCWVIIEAIWVIYQLTKSGKNFQSEKFPGWW